MQIENPPNCRSDCRIIYARIDQAVSFCWVFGTLERGTADRLCKRQQLGSNTIYRLRGVCAVGKAVAAS